MEGDISATRVYLLSSFCVVKVYSAHLKIIPNTCICIYIKTNCILHDLHVHCIKCYTLLIKKKVVLNNFVKLLNCMHIQFIEWHPVVVLEIN